MIACDLYKPRLRWINKNVYILNEFNDEKESAETKETVNLNLDSHALTPSEDGYNEILRKQGLV